MKRLRLLIPMVALVLVLFAVGCAGYGEYWKRATAIAPTRTASDVQDKVEATLSAPTLTTAPPTPMTESKRAVTTTTSRLLTGGRLKTIREYNNNFRLKPDGEAVLTATIGASRIEKGDCIVSEIRTLTAKQLDNSIVVTECASSTWKYKTLNSFKVNRNATVLEKAKTQCDRGYTDTLYWWRIVNGVKSSTTEVHCLQRR